MMYPSILRDMLIDQRRLQIDAYGQDPHSMNQEERIRFIKDMTYALEDELHEAVAETGWKPWQTSKHINEEAFKAELVDAWHFFMNLMLVVGMTEADLIEGYYAKRQKNIDRQRAGYDGVNGKCPKCRRALDDNAVICDPSSGWCMDDDD